MKYGKKTAWIGLAATALLFTGCSSKSYFEPENTYSASAASSSYGGVVTALTRDGATLENGRYIGQGGISPVNLGEGYRFLNENDKYVLASNTEGMLKIIDKQTKEQVRNVSMKVPVVSAAINAGKIAYILNDNTFGLYEIAGNKKVVERRSEHAYAIDTRAASPMFIDSLAVFPMLDGKIVIVNATDVANAKVVYISAKKVFNNVIYLSRTGNTMVAATPHNLLTLGSAGKAEFGANIADVAISGGMVYLFTKEGEVIKLTKDLKPVSKTKFKFAHFSLATAFGNKVYALDQQGSLIVLNSDLTKHKIYDIGAVKKPAFVSGTKLYKDGDIIELSKLGYGQ